MKKRNNQLELRLGKVPSLNSFYSGSHWTKRKRAKDAALKEVKNQLGFNPNAPYYSMRITAYVRYRYDLDNSIIAIKFACDALKALGWIVDDSPKYFRYLVLEWSGEIPKDEARLIISLSDEKPQQGSTSRI